MDALVRGAEWTEQPEAIELEPVEKLLSD